MEAIELPTPDGTIDAYLYGTTADQPASTAAVVLSDIYGCIPFYHEIAARLACAGHNALLLDLFTREDPLSEVTRSAAYDRHAKMDEAGAVRDALAAVDWMRERFAGLPVATIGFCLGGQLALNVAARRSDVLTVSVYGFPEGMSSPARSPAPRPVDEAHRLRGPILALWAEQDHVVDLESVRRFERVLEANGVDHKSQVYAGVGHGFLQGLVQPRSDSAAAHDAWDQTLRLLRSEEREESAMTISRRLDDQR